MHRKRYRRRLYERIPPVVFIHDDGYEEITRFDDVPVGITSDPNVGRHSHQALPFATKKKASVVAKAAAKKFGGKPIVMETLVAEWWIKKSKRSSFDSPETGMLRVFLAAITNIKFDHLEYSSRKTKWYVNDEFVA